MQHQFVIGVSGYTTFPAIGDPTPVRLLPPPVDPKRFIRRCKRKAFASWDEKVRLMQTWNVVDKFPLRVTNYSIPPPPPLQVRGSWGDPTAQEVDEHARSWGISHNKAWNHLCSRRELLARAKVNGITVEEQEVRESREENCRRSVLASVAFQRASEGKPIFQDDDHHADRSHADQSIVGKRGRGTW